MCHRKNARQRFSVSARSRNLRSVEHCHSDSPIPSPENRNFGPGTFFRNQPHNCRRSNFSAEIKLHFFQFSNFVFRDCSLRTSEASNWPQIFHHSFALSFSEKITEKAMIDIRDVCHHSIGFRSLELDSYVMPAETLLEC